MADFDRDAVQAHQQVLASDGTPIGTVDHVDGERIKLTRADSEDGQHHYLPLDMVDKIQGDTVHLKANGGDVAQHLDGE